LIVPLGANVVGFPQEAPGDLRWKNGVLLRKTIPKLLGLAARPIDWRAGDCHRSTPGIPDQHEWQSDRCAARSWRARPQSDRLPKSVHNLPHSQSSGRRPQMGQPDRAPGRWQSQFERLRSEGSWCLERQKRERHVPRKKVGDGKADSSMMDYGSGKGAGSSPMDGAFLRKSRTSDQIAGLMDAPSPPEIFCLATSPDAGPAG